MTEKEQLQVGGIGEEAVKLLRALQDWAGDTSGNIDQPRAGGLQNDLNEHIATGGKDCQYCPVCQLISAVRATSPEVKYHLNEAASSLLQAASGVLADRPASRRGDDDPVEHIDLGGDDWEDGD